MEKRRFRSAFRAFRDSRGTFSLPELLVASALMLVVFAAILTLVPMAFRQSQVSQERSFTVLEVREAVERMMREMRTASTPSPSAQKITYDTPSKSVVIECTQGAGQGGSGQGQGEGVCNRREAPLGQNPSNNPAVAVASRVVNTDVFCVAASPAAQRQYIGVKIVISIPGSTAPVTIADATSLRNVQPSTSTTPQCPN